MSPDETMLSHSSGDQSKADQRNTIAPSILSVGFSVADRQLYRLTLSFGCIFFPEHTITVEQAKSTGVQIQISPYTTNFLQK
jgi:hypothetical protein